MKLRGIIGSTMVTGSMTMLSRCFGLARDIILARIFGAGLDSFLVAFRLPNMLRRIFAEGALSQALVPILGEYRERGDYAGMKALNSQLAAWIGGALLLLYVLCIFLAPFIVIVFAPGFIGKQQFTEAGFMLKLTFFYLPCMSMASLAAAAFHVHNKFALPAFAPILLNVCLIAAALLLAPELDTPLYALAMAVPVAGILQLAILLPYLAKLKVLAWPSLNADRTGARRVIKVMLPAVFGVSVTQCNLVIDTWLASFLREGSITWLYYADRMMELPLGVFGVALATVILPQLAAVRDAGRQKHELLDFGLRWALLISLPAMLGLILLAEEVMLSLFSYDNFTTADARQAALALCAYMPGLPAMVLVKILATEYFSRQDTATPARIAAMAVGCNLVFNLALIKFLGHVGLALATSAAAWCNAWLLYRGLRKSDNYSPCAGWPLFLGRLVLALLLMSLCLHLLYPDISTWASLSAASRVLWLTVLVVAGAVTFMASSWLVGMRDWKLR